MRNLDVELFPESGSEPNLEGFHASEPAGNLSGGVDSGSEAVTELDDDEGSLFPDELLALLVEETN